MSDTSLVDPSQSVYSSLGIPRGGDAAIGQAGKYLGEAAGAAEAENRDPEIARLREKKATLAERETSDDIYKHVEPFNPQNAPSAKDYTTDPVQSFFSLGSVFGILASAFTHQPWTTSMSAAAAAINARNQGDKDAYDYAFKEWQSNSDLMLKRHAAQIDDWNAIQEKYKNDQGALDAALQAHEAKYDDPAARALRLSGAYGQYYDLIDKRTQNGIAVQEARPGLVKAGMLTSALLGYQDALKSGDPAKISSARDAYTQLQSDFTGIKSTDLSEPMNVTVDDGKGGKRPVLAIFNKSTQQWISADGSATPLTGVTTATKIASGATAPGPGGNINQQKAWALGLLEQSQNETDPDKKKQMEDKANTVLRDIQKVTQITSATAGRSAATAAVNKFMQDNPNASAEEIVQFAAHANMEIKATQQFGTGPLGNSVRSLNVVVDHLHTLMDLSKELGNGNIQMFNELANRVAEETGQPAPTNFDAAKQIVGQEVVKAIVGSGAGGVNERQDAAERVQRDMSNQQYEGAVSTIDRLMGGQLKGLRLQYERTTGKKDFEDNLFPATKDALEAASGGSGVGGGLPSGWSVKVK